MQQRRLRLGDILDDYCPRERRITNHAVVAMIEDDVRQTRCTTCDAEHEYKQAKVPASRRKKAGETTGDLLPPVLSAPALDESVDAPDEVLIDKPAPLLTSSPDDSQPGPTPRAGDSDMPLRDDDGEASAPADDEGPVHRPLIRATLPRPEGQVPERKAPDFTMRQPGGRFDQNRNGQRNRGRQPARNAGQSFGPSSRGGGPRQGSGRPGGEGQRQRNGNSSGNTAGQRGGRPFGPDRGPRSGGGGHGRKRGR
jgi:hypothetical protein